MAEGFYRSGEARPSGAGVSEPTGTDSTYTADEEMPGQARRHAGTRVAETAPAASAAPARSVLKRPFLLLMAVVLLGVTAVAGWRYYTYFIAHEWTDDAFIEGRIIQISPKVAGHVSQVYVTDNQEVQQGDLLLEIDPRDYTARLMQARAVLQAAMTKQQTAAESLHSMESQVLEAQARVDEALGRLAAANAAPHQVAMSRSQADTASAEVAQARAAVEHAEL